MAIVPKNLESATAAERADYARRFLNLDLSGHESDEQIIASIRSAQPGNANIFVEEDTSVKTEDRRPDWPSGADDDDQRGQGSLGRGDPRVTIFIPKVENLDGSGADDVAVGVNGVVWQLKRGENLDVPIRVVEALGLTEQDIIRHDDDGNVVTNKAMRFSFNVIKYPSTGEVEAWRTATNAKFCP